MESINKIDRKLTRDELYFKYQGIVGKAVKKTYPSLLLTSEDYYSFASISLLEELDSFKRNPDDYEKVPLSQSLYARVKRDLHLESKVTNSEFTLSTYVAHQISSYRDEKEGLPSALSTLKQLSTTSLDAEVYRESSDNLHEVIQGAEGVDLTLIREEEFKILHEFFEDIKEKVKEPIQREILDNLLEDKLIPAKLVDKYNMTKGGVSYHKKALFKFIRNELKLNKYRRVNESRM